MCIDEKTDTDRQAVKYADDDDKTPTFNGNKNKQPTTPRPLSSFSFVYFS